MPLLKTGDLEGMKAFATTVKTLVMTMQNLRSEGHMYNPQLARTGTCLSTAHHPETEVGRSNREARVSGPQLAHIW